MWDGPPPDQPQGVAEIDLLNLGLSVSQHASMESFCFHLCARPPLPHVEIRNWWGCHERQRLCSSWELNLGFQV